MLTRMISEQNAVLKHQTQQITVMLQLITNVLSKKNKNRRSKNSSLELKRPTTTGPQN